MSAPAWGWSCVCDTCGTERKFDQASSATVIRELRAAGWQLGAVSCYCPGCRIQKRRGKR